MRRPSNAVATRPRPCAVPCVLLAALLLAACGRDPRPDVLLIVLDTVRADHVSAYGYARATMPALDALAADGVLYRRAIAPGTWSVPSHASLFTGLLPSEHGAYHASTSVGGGIHALDPSIETLAERMTAANYRTAAFIGNSGYLDPVFGMARGFRRYSYTNMQDAAQLADRMIAWLRRRRGRSVFVFVNIIDPHAPYAAPPPYDRLFPGRLDGVDPRPWQRFAVTGELPSPAEMAHHVSQYDGELRYVDDQLGRILATMRDLGRYDNALIVVTADHGDLFGEHGQLGHGGRPWHPLVHVPLVVKYPHGARRGVEERPVSLVDVAPTILATLGLPPMHAGGAPLWARTGPVVSESQNPAETARAVYDDAGHVLFEVVHGEHREVALYDLGTDPDQAHPLAPAADPAGSRLEAALAARLPPGSARSPGPVVFPEADRKLARRLRALGYLH